MYFRSSIIQLHVRSRQAKGLCGLGLTAHSILAHFLLRKCEFDKYSALGSLFARQMALQSHCDDVEPCSAPRRTHSQWTREHRDIHRPEHII